MAENIIIKHKLILTLKSKCGQPTTQFAKCQFHQRFMRAFFVPKSFWQLFSSYILAKKALSYKNARVKC
jgi:hypothetical protein